MSKKLFFSLLLLTNLAWAQPSMPKAGDVYESVTYDLNGDGKAEKIGLVAYNIHLESESFWGRLRVTDATGRVIWEAPKASKSGQPFAFGMWPYGASGLDWLGDMDGDGKVELISRGAISDVRPPTYRRYRWTGKGFQALSSKMLLESPLGSGKFLWRDPIDWDGSPPLTWVMSLSGAPSKKVAEVMSYPSEGEYLMGTAETSGNGLGLSITSWITKLGPSQ